MLNACQLRIKAAQRHSSSSTVTTGSALTAMAQFSGAVKIADLNDFIAPSQSCVVSLKGNKLEIGKDEQVCIHIRMAQRRWYQVGVCMQDTIGQVQIQKAMPVAEGFSQTKTSGDNGAVKVCPCI